MTEWDKSTPRERRPEDRQTGHYVDFCRVCGRETEVYVSTGELTILCAGCRAGATPGARPEVER